MPPKANTYDLSDEQLRRVLDLRRERAAITDELDRILGSVSEIDRPSWGPCKRCGYTWKGLWRNKKPKHCANCHAPNWDKVALAPVRRKQVVVPSGLTPPPSLSTPFTSPGFISNVGTQYPPQPERYSRPMEGGDASLPAQSADNSTTVASTHVLEQQLDGQATDGADQFINEPVPSITEMTLEEIQANCSHPTYKILDGICIGCGKEFPDGPVTPDIPS